MEVRDGFDVVTSRIKCLQGWLVTLNAILQVWEHLKTHYSFKFLLTRRLNSDPIENFFGAIRQQGGNNDNPTPAQFTRAFRKLFFSSFLQTSNGNCDQDLDTLLAQFSNEKSNMPTLVKPSNQPNTLDIGPTDYHDNDVNSSIIEANAICYVAGCLLRKCLSKHNCEICRDRLVVNQLDDNRKMFCFFKAYDTEKSEFGGLLAPSVPFLDFITQMEDVFIANFSIFGKSSSVEKHILAN